MAKILLVEDDELIARMISLRLSIAGHDVDLAENGRKGLEKIRNNEFDLVLMDMHMPEMDGHETVRILRKDGYSGTIVAVTASAMSSDSRKAIKSGCNYFISKPIGEDFEGRIEEFLKLN